MTKSLKTLLGILILVAVAAGIYFAVDWYVGNKMGGSAVFSNEPATLPSGTSTTDTSLEEDTAAIDAELTGLEADQVSADASLKESAQVQ